MRRAIVSFRFSCDSRWLGCVVLFPSGAQLSTRLRNPLRDFLASVLPQLSKCLIPQRPSGQLPGTARALVLIMPTNTATECTYSIDSTDGTTLATVETNEFQDVIEIAQCQANILQADVVVWQMSNGQDDVDESDALTISPSTDRKDAGIEFWAKVDLAK